MSRLRSQRVCKDDDEPQEFWDKFTPKVQKIWKKMNKDKEFCLRSDEDIFNISLTSLSDLQPTEFSNRDDENENGQQSPMKSEHSRFSKESNSESGSIYNVTGRNRSPSLESVVSHRVRERSEGNSSSRNTYIIHKLPIDNQSENKSNETPSIDEENSKHTTSEAQSFSSESLEEHSTVEKHPDDFPNENTYKIDSLEHIEERSEGNSSSRNTYIIDKLHIDNQSKNKSNEMPSINDKNSRHTTSEAQIFSSDSLEIHNTVEIHPDDLSNGNTYKIDSLEHIEERSEGNSSSRNTYIIDKLHIHNQSKNKSNEMPRIDEENSRHTTSEAQSFSSESLEEHSTVEKHPDDFSNGNTYKIDSLEHIEERSEGNSSSRNTYIIDKLHIDNQSKNKSNEMPRIDEENSRHTTSEAQSFSSESLEEHSTVEKHPDDFSNGNTYKIDSLEHIEERSEGNSSSRNTYIIDKLHIDNHSKNKSNEMPRIDEENSRHITSEAQTFSSDSLEEHNTVGKHPDDLSNGNTYKIDSLEHIDLDVNNEFQNISDLELMRKADPTNDLQNSKCSFRANITPPEYSSPRTNERRCEMELRVSEDINVSNLTREVLDADEIEAINELDIDPCYKSPARVVKRQNESNIILRQVKKSKKFGQWSGVKEVNNSCSDSASPEHVSLNQEHVMQSLSTQTIITIPPNATIPDNSCVLLNHFYFEKLAQLMSVKDQLKDILFDLLRYINKG